MKRIKLTIAYDGTNYCGWQFQPNALSVEEVVTKGLRSLLGEEVVLTGASRTDAGVHALGNVATFDSDTKIPPEKICYAVNAYLPEDVRVMASEAVEDDFHPRFDAHDKCYEYTINCEPMANPLERLYAYHVRQELDVVAMQRAADYLVGEHDFTSFCSAGAQVVSKVRRIYLLDVMQERGNLVIRVTGNGFLYNMIRIIVGTLVKVGLGQLDANKMPDILAAMNREVAGPTAPANGLKLLWINYN